MMNTSNFNFRHFKMWKKLPFFLSVGTSKIITAYLQLKKKKLSLSIIWEGGWHGIWSHSFSTQSHCQYKLCCQYLQTEIHGKTDIVHSSLHPFPLCSVLKNKPDTLKFAQPLHFVKALSTPQSPYLSVDKYNFHYSLLSSSRQLWWFCLTCFTVLPIANTSE